MKTEEFLDLLTQQIRCKIAREPIRREFQNHMEEQMECFLSSGMKKADAEKAAVREMGDPVEIGSSLDRIHRPKMAWGSIIVITGLSTAGLFLQYFLQSRFGGADSVSGMWEAFTFLGICIVLMIGVCFFDYSRIGYRARELMIFLFLALYLGKRIFCVPVNDSDRWINLFGVQGNIAVAVLLSVPLYAGILFLYRRKKGSAIIKAYLWMIPGIFLSLSVQSITAALILFLTYTMLLSAALIKGWFLVSKRKMLAAIWGGTLLLPFLLYLVIMNCGSSYHQLRLQSLLSGASDSYNYPLETVRLLLTQSSMLGNTRDTVTLRFRKIFFPEYILSYTIFYYGILAGILLIGIILLLVMRFYHVSLRQKSQLGMLMGTGCSTVLLAQVLLYLMDNLGITQRGYYCPFLTGGRSKMAVTFLLFGIMLSIFRYENLPERAPGAAGQTILKKHKKMV